MSDPTTEPQRPDRVTTDAGQTHRRWPIWAAGVIGAFLLGYFLPSIVYRAVSQFLVVVAPDSGGLEMDIPQTVHLLFGCFLAIGAGIGLLRPPRSSKSRGKARR